MSYTSFFYPCTTQPSIFPSFEISKHPLGVSKSYSHVSSHVESEGILNVWGTPLFRCPMFPTAEKLLGRSLFLGGWGIKPRWLNSGMTKFKSLKPQKDKIKAQITHLHGGKLTAVRKQSGSSATG